MSEIPETSASSQPSCQTSSPYDELVSRSRAARAPTIERVPVTLRRMDSFNRSIPIVVAIGPYHDGGSPQLKKMEQVKRDAVEHFCRRASQSHESVRAKILSVADLARRCYADDKKLDGMDQDSFAEMMLMDGCFLLQYMISMCPDEERGAPPEPDPLMSMAEVHTRVDAIARDILLLENQVPWVVLKALMELMTPAAGAAPVLVERFVALLAGGFDVGGDNVKPNPPGLGGGGEPDYEPPHLLGLFHHRQVGGARTQSLRAPSLSSMSITALELAEMGVKLTARKTKRFGDMSMTKRRRLLSGELSVAPVVLNDLTACWLYNMAVYEACLGTARADNFAVSSYVSLVSLLMNRDEDVQELRAKGIVVSEFSDSGTLRFFKVFAQYLRVGHRYYQVFERLQEYKQERWMWISIHRFFYNNFKTIVTVLSIIGVLAGLFKTLLSLKQPQR